jgi:hypothetical protein
MEVASTLVVATSSTSLVHPPLPLSALMPPPQSTTSKNGGKNNNKKRNKNTSSPSTNSSAPLPTWSAPYNPWTGVVQAWLMPIWRPSASGLLGPRLGNATQSALTTMPYQSYSDPQQQPQVGLMAALQGVPHPSQYTSGNDWIMDTSARYHMANNPGILVSSFPPLSIHL